MFDRERRLQRVPDSVIKAMPHIEKLARRCPGARLRFRTDSKTLHVGFTLKTLAIDIGMSIYSCQSAHVLCGSGNDLHFLGLVNVKNYDTKTAEAEFSLSGNMSDIMIYLPRNEIIEDLWIKTDDNANILPCTPYQGNPIVYYGSSITEGGCACNPFNAYNAIISNHINMDYYNLGFSNSAKGELIMADFINTLNMSMLVYDYDHNAPDAAHLAKTHEAFFKRIRALHPKLPILILTMPKETYTVEKERREIIFRTYKNAVNSGDKNVYFIDGESYYGAADRHCCSIDGIHPNDLGFYRMAQVIEPKIRAILNIKQSDFTANT